MGKITDQLTRYHDGKITFDQLATWLGQFDYVPPAPPIGSEDEPATAEQVFPLEDSVQEIVSGIDAGLITNDEFDRILEHLIDG